MGIEDQGSEPVDPSALAAMEALLDVKDEVPPDEEEEREDQPAEEPEQDEPEEPAKEGDDDNEESEDAKPEPVEETEEITWNGETRKVSKAELKELAQKGFDYTQKTQQLAEERRHIDAAVKQAQQSFEIQNQQIETIAIVKSLDAQLDQFRGVNWHNLAESNPVEYLKLNQTYRDLKEAREGKVQEFHQQAQTLTQMQSQAFQEVLKKEYAALSSHPDFAGERAAQTKSKVKDFLKSEGYSDDEIGNVLDHRAIKVAWKAAQWDALQNSKSKIEKKVADVPKVIKSSSAKAPNSNADKEAFKRLRETGRGEYAAKLIERML